MTEETVKEIIESLLQIQTDLSVPKNVRSKMENAIKALQDQEKNLEKISHYKN